MRLLVLAFPLLAATSSLAAGNGQDEVTRSFQKTVALSGNQGLSLDHRFGQVRIHGDGRHEAKISAGYSVQGFQCQ